MSERHTATGHIVGEMPSGHLRVELLDGEHEGSTWAMLRRYDRDGEFTVEYYPEDQFVAPKGTSR